MKLKTMERKTRTYRKWIDTDGSRFFYLKSILDVIGINGKSMNGRARAIQYGIIDDLGITAGNYNQMRIGDQPKRSIPYISSNSVCTIAFKSKSEFSDTLRRMILDRVSKEEIEKYRTTKIDEYEVSSQG